MTLDSVYCNANNVIVLTSPFVPLFLSLPAHYLIFSLLPLLGYCTVLGVLWNLEMGKKAKNAALFVDNFFNCLWGHTKQNTWKAE